MAPKPPPKPPPTPPPRKNFFERFSDYLDSDQGRKRTAILVLLFFVLAVLMFYMYKAELNKGRDLKLAVASIRQFALEYDPSLQGKTDMEVLAAVHLLTLQLLNWTEKNEELEKELKILTELLPGWVAFEKNLYYFSQVRKTWFAARDDCLARHTADLVTCKYGEEQASTFTTLANGLLLGKEIIMGLKERRLDPRSMNQSSHGPNPEKSSLGPRGRDWPTLCFYEHCPERTGLFPERCLCQADWVNKPTTNRMLIHPALGKFGSGLKASLMVEAEKPALSPYLPAGDSYDPNKGSPKWQEYR
ncbi:uncharacterized protein LOC131203123 [Ahaetulla prasina]|uniref:uncharacterized protein LOC131203123 n=1 Tax=Ahaetulla prasina TaxID=499056 RepID=UPI00264A38B5|nr:uncharacterized protein LOC131203123 [Ahaetulla prasina]